MKELELEDANALQVHFNIRLQKMVEVRPHSEHLSELADLALSFLSDPASLSGKEDELTVLFAKASKSFGATNLPITKHVQKLVQSATKN